MYSYIAVACLLGVAVAAPSGLTGVIDSVSVPHYGFNYAVSDPLTGDNKAQSEVRDGGVVKGSYSLNEPDGTIRVVEYRADPVTGFNAVVKRIGSAVHPQVLPVKAIAAPVAAVAAVPSSVIGLGGYGLGHGGIGLGHGGIGLGHGGIGLGYGNIGLGIGGIGLGYGDAGLGYGNIGLGYGGLGHGGLGWKH